MRRNPVTGGCWVPGIDPIRPQKKAALRALLAREWFAQHAPPDAPPLPVSVAERENVRLSANRLNLIVAYFARSSESGKYNFNEHPSFEDYAQGLFASTHMDAYLKAWLLEDSDLANRYPPSPLPGLGPGLYWDPPKRQSQYAQRHGRRCTRPRDVMSDKQKQFLESVPPLFPLNALVGRYDANVPDWYAPWAQNFLQVTDEFIAHATKCAPYRRLPRHWLRRSGGDVFSRWQKEHSVSVVASDYGWLIERNHSLDAANIY